jgi:hypothetical protein
MTLPTRLLTLALLAAAVFPMHGQQASSPDAFLKEVLAAFSAKDQQALEHFVVTEAEFKQCVWPSIAAQVSGSNTTAAKFYQTFSAASKIGLANRLGEMPDQNDGLVNASFGPEERQKGCRLLTAPTVAIRAADGPQKTVKIAAGILWG